MRDRDLVRFVLRATDAAATRSAAFGRARIGTDNGDGSYQVTYKGREVRLEGRGQQLSEGESVDVCRSNGQLALTDLSAYA